MILGRSIEKVTESYCNVGKCERVRRGGVHSVHDLTKFEFMPNNLPSFKVIVYNSENKKILSEKVTPDFTDTHQTISPIPGYKIADKSKQHPSQIKACAQESFSENRKTKTHEDCFPIQQDKTRLTGIP